MSKVQAQTRNGCQRHQFRFLPKDPDCHYQDTVELGICGQSGKGSNKLGSKCYEGPVYNKDKCVSSPAFLLKSEKEQLKGKPLPDPQKQAQCLQMPQSKSLLLLAKPNSKNLYCNVCKEQYEDYRHHIQAEEHKDNIQNNVFNKYIIKLADKYRRVRDMTGERERSRWRDRQVEKYMGLRERATGVGDPSNPVVVDKDQADVETLGRPKKKTKLSSVEMGPMSYFGPPMPYPHPMHMAYQSHYRMMDPYMGMNAYMPPYGYHFYPPLMPMAGSGQRNYPPFYNPMLPMQGLNRQAQPTRREGTQPYVIVIDDDI